MTRGRGRSVFELSRLHVIVTLRHSAGWYSYTHHRCLALNSCHMSRLHIPSILPPPLQQAPAPLPELQTSEPCPWLWRTDQWSWNTFSSTHQRHWQNHWAWFDDHYLKKKKKNVPPFKAQEGQTGVFASTNPFFVLLVQRFPLNVEIVNVLCSNMLQQLKNWKNIVEKNAHSKINGLTFFCSGDTWLAC